MYIWRKFVYIGLLLCVVQKFIKLEMYVKNTFDALQLVLTAC